MSRQLKIIALACFAVVVFIVGIQLLFEWKPGTPTKAEFDSEFKQVIASLAFGYKVPDSLAVAKMDSGCRNAPDPSNSSCVEYVDHLREADPTLAGLVDELDKLLDKPAPDVQSDLIVTANEWLERYRLTHEANLLLLEAWDSSDHTTWVRAWKMRDSTDR